MTKRLSRSEKAYRRRQRAQKREVDRAVKLLMEHDEDFRRLMEFKDISEVGEVSMSQLMAAMLEEQPQRIKFSWEDDPDKRPMGEVLMEQVAQNNIVLELMKKRGAISR